MFQLFPLSRVSHHVAYRRYSSLNNIIITAREKLQKLGNGQIDLNIEDDKGLASITLNNQEKKNALSGKMMVQLENIVNELETWKKGKTVVLQANGDSFCSGGDLETVRSINNPDDGFLMSCYMHHILTKLYCLPFLTVSLVQGKALGGGAELTTATDFRIFTDKAQIGFVQAKMGVITGWGGGTRLVKLIGATASLDLLCTSKIIGANEGLDLGLVDCVINHDSRYSELNDWIMTRTCHDYTVIQAIKKTIISARDNFLHDSLSNERNCFSPLWGGPANIDALRKNIKHK